MFEVLERRIDDLERRLKQQARPVIVQRHSVTDMSNLDFVPGEIFIAKSAGQNSIYVVLGSESDPQIYEANLTPI